MCFTRFNLNCLRCTVKSVSIGSSYLCYNIGVGSKTCKMDNTVSVSGISAVCVTYNSSFAVCNLEYSAVKRLTCSLVKLCDDKPAFGRVVECEVMNLTRYYIYRLGFTADSITCRGFNFSNYISSGSKSVHLDITVNICCISAV